MIRNDHPETKRADNRSDWWGFGPKPFECNAERESRFHYKIKLFGPIEDASQFAEAIDVFERATPDDRITVYLSSPGGSVDATDTFLHAMHNCEAPVHIVASGGCHSAATIILLNSQSFTLSHNFNALIHNGSMGSYGKVSDFRAEARFNMEYMDKLMRETYKGFLSEEEINQLIAGKDFWMDAKEFCERHERRNELFADEHQAEALEELEQAQEQLAAIVENARKKPGRKKAEAAE